MVTIAFLTRAERLVEPLGQALGAQVRISQQHTNITVPTEMLKVDQRETTWRIAANLRNPGNGFVPQIVHMEVIVVCEIDRHEQPAVRSVRQNLRAEDLSKQDGRQAGYRRLNRNVLHPVCRHGSDDWLSLAER